MKKKQAQHHDILNEIRDCLHTGNHFLVTTHMRIDGDAVASALVFTAILRYLGKSYQILIHDHVPDKFHFMKHVGDLKHVKSTALEPSPDTVVVLDASSLSRTGDVAALITDSMKIINVDHHPGNNRFGHYNLVDEGESSTVELVYHLFCKCDVPMTASIAETVFTGITSDTGRFRFPNTTYRSFLVCAEMLKHGVSPCKVAEHLYYNNSPETQRALARALSAMEMHYDGAVSCMHLDNAALKSGTHVDTEGFVDYLLQIRGTSVEFFMLEEKPDLYRVSFRSKMDVDVNEIAKIFGGGGHAKASGCYIQGSLPEVKKKILTTLEPYVK